MAEPARKTTAGQSFVFGQVPQGATDKEIWVSPPQSLRYSGQTNTDQQYSIVFFPATGESLAIERTYILGSRQLLSQDKGFAKLNQNGTWEPLPYASNLGGQSLVDALNRNQSLSANLNASTNYTISSVYKQQNNGTSPTSQQISQIKAGTAGVVPGAAAAVTDPSPAAPGTTPAPTGTTPAAPSDPKEGDLGQTKDVVERAIGQVEATAINVQGQATATRPSAKGLSYPLKFPERMDYVRFSAKSYGNKTFNSSTFGFRSSGDPNSRDRRNSATGESVILPIQPSTSDTNSVGWNEETFNPAQVVGANLAISGISGGFTGFAGTLNEILSKAGSPGAKGDIEQAIIAYFTEQAVGVQILPKISGAVFNPNTELLFQGPQLRAFNFSYKLSPRSKDEAIRVKNIIAFFKRNMAAQTTEGELYLKAPRVFGIEYFHGGGGSHSGINLIKDCALQSCSVDYTPDGSYMAFEDGAMVSYNINLQFMELEPIYSKDYDSVSDGSIGY